MPLCGADGPLLVLALVLDQYTEVPWAAGPFYLYKFVGYYLLLVVVLVVAVVVVEAPQAGSRPFW